MKKQYSLPLFILITLLITACESDNEGHVHLTWEGWVIIGAILAFFIFLIGSLIFHIINSIPVQKKAKNRLRKLGIDPEQVYYMGMYVGGHPEIDNQIASCRIYKKDSDFVICENVNYFPMPISTIPIAAIRYIQVEDKSSIEKKVTIGRILLVGVFALAWTKNKKEEINFITIDWNDGRFNHSTVFAFHGEAGVQMANKTRNILIKLA